MSHAEFLGVPPLIRWDARRVPRNNRARPALWEPPTTVGNRVRTEDVTVRSSEYTERFKIRVVSVFRIKSKLRGSKMAMLSPSELAAEHWQPRLSKNSRKCAVVSSAPRSTTLIVGSSSSPLSQPPERKSHDPNLPHTQHSTASVAKPSHLQSSSRRAKVCLSPCLRDFPEGFEKCWNAKF